MDPLNIPPDGPAPSDERVVRVLLQDGTIAQPVQPSDLAPLAKDATVATLGTQTTLLNVSNFTQNTANNVQNLDIDIRGSALAYQQTIDLTAAKVALNLAFGNLTYVKRIRVTKLVGATAQLIFISNTYPPFDVVAGDDFPDLHANAALIYLNSPGGAGGSITLQFFGI